MLVVDDDTRGTFFSLSLLPTIQLSTKSLRSFNQPALVYGLDHQSTKPRSSAHSLVVPSTRLPPAWVSRVTTSPSPTHVSPFRLQFSYTTPVTWDLLPAVPTVEPSNAIRIVPTNEWSVAPAEPTSPWSLSSRSRLRPRLSLNRVS